MLMKLNICNVLYVVEYKTLPQSGIISRVSLILFIEIFTNTTGGYKIHIKGGVY